MWLSPIPLVLVPTSDRDSFLTIPEGMTGLPIGDHPGAFGVQRKFHTHEGIDLYCPESTPVYAVEDSVIVGIESFTGEFADPPSPWWKNTMAVLAEGPSGVVVYGEILPATLGHKQLSAGSLIGYVTEVLRENKGRPTSMLHLELHKHGTRKTYEWLTERPESLLDPTPFLLNRG